MYLKALEIQGFKSFPDKTVLPFDEQITAVVGPNGSGKSNIYDAISWVVGEQSARSLRGEKMEDVVFVGTSKRNRTGYAQVSLIMDNSTGIFPMEETEVCVTRKYYRSGNSEYFINKNQSRLRDIHSLFMGTGLGKEGYALIGQGRIAEILSVRSSERREVFEEAAGIARFRHQKEESERKLARAEENMLRIQDKITELELQVKPLEEESEKAKKYLLLRDELRVLEISVWLTQLDSIKEKQKTLETDFAAADAEKTKVEQEQSQREEAITALGEQIQAKNMEADQLRRELSSRETQVVEQESSVNMLKNNISNNENNAKQLEETLEQTQAREEEFKKQLAQEEEKERGLETRRVALKEENNVKTQEAVELSRLLEETKTMLGQVAQDLERESQSVAVAKSNLSALTSSTQEILDQDETLRQELGEIMGRVEQEKHLLQEAESQVAQGKEKRDQGKNTVSGYEMKVESRQNKVNSLKQQHETLSRDCHLLENKIKLLTDRENSYDDFNVSVKKVMAEAKRGGLRNIHGTVADLIQVDSQYSLALETALGLSMQNIVVDTFQDGSKVIDFLQRTKGGRVTVLPLASMSASYLQQKDAVAREEGFVGIADELVSCHPDYRTAVSSLLGRTVVMTDRFIAEATSKKYQRKLRIVTLDGQILNPGGTVTGGSSKASGGILSHKAELEQMKVELGKKADDLAQITQQHDELSASLSGELYELEMARNELRQYEDAILQLEGQRDVHLHGLEALQQQGTQAEQKLSQLEERSEKVEGSTQKAQNLVQTQEATVAQLRGKYEQMVLEQQRLQEQWQSANDAAMQLTSQLSALATEESLMAQAKENIRTLLADITAQLTNDSTRIQDFGKENQEYSAEILDLEDKIKESRQACVDLGEKIRSTHQAQLDLEQSRNQKDRESKEMSHHLMSLVRAVTLLGGNKEQAQREEDQIINKLWDSYELSHQAALEVRAELDSMEQTKKRIGELERAIRNLGSVNVNAIEQFEKINERYTYLIDQRDDVLQAKKELEQIIAGIVKEMEEIFMREFEKINEAFGRIFQQLFGGGRAEVILDDAQDVLGSGIEIRAQPPGKALEILSLLSGGEKSFVAVALYFAILEIRPTPFLVMDEIDAALDDSNIERFVQYLKMICHKTQVIIITHRRGTMETADVLYGITMQEKGVSRMLRLSLNEVEETLGMKL